MPVFGLGILPCGPRTRPSLPTAPIMSGVAIATSKSVNPPSILAARSSPPTKSAPASSASRALSPWANTATRTLLPVPCGRLIVPRSCWSAWRTLTPRRMWTSTVESKRVSSWDLIRRIAAQRRVDLACGDFGLGLLVALTALGHFDSSLIGWAPTAQSSDCGRAPPVTAARPASPRPARPCCGPFRRSSTSRPRRCWRSGPASWSRRSGAPDPWSACRPCRSAAPQIRSGSRAPGG